VSPAPRPIAIGAMRLSTAGDRDDERAGQVLDAALAAGVTWIDTADVYARDQHDLGHNERLVAAAVARHAGAGGTAVAAGSTAPGVTVITKGGLVRDGTRWASDGRAQHLAAAARASRERLGGAPIDL
jgi:aryl-alcohol dehydrogenase-like predicted oxidoreductase